MKKTRREVHEVHEVHSRFILIDLTHVLLIFPHVHDGHEVH